MMASPFLTLMLFSLINGVNIVVLMRDVSVINYFYLEVEKDIMVDILKILENLMVQMEIYLVMQLENLMMMVVLSLELGIMVTLKERMID